MTKPLLPVAAFTALMAAGGCAGPRDAVVSSGAWPAGGSASFGFGRFDAGEPEDVRGRIASCLAAHGMIQADDKPAYLVQLALSDHPARTQVIDPAAPPAARPGGGRRHDLSFSVSISEVATGREAYRVTATRRGGGKRAAGSPSDLVDAACAAIGVPPATS